MRVYKKPARGMRAQRFVSLFRAYDIVYVRVILRVRQSARTDSERRNIEARVLKPLCATAYLPYSLPVCVYSAVKEKYRRLSLDALFTKRLKKNATLCFIHRKRLVFFNRKSKIKTFLCST